MKIVESKKVLLNSCLGDLTQEVSIVNQDDDRVLVLAEGNDVKRYYLSRFRSDNPNRYDFKENKDVFHTLGRILRRFNIQDRSITKHIYDVICEFDPEYRSDGLLISYGMKGSHVYAKGHIYQLEILQSIRFERINSVNLKEIMTDSNGDPKGEAYYNIYRRLNSNIMLDSINEVLLSYVNEIDDVKEYVYTEDDKLVFSLMKEGYRDTTSIVLSDIVMIDLTDLKNNGYEHIVKSKSSIKTMMSSIGYSFVNETNMPNLDGERGLHLYFIKNSLDDIGVNLYRYANILTDLFKIISGSFHIGRTGDRFKYFLKSNELSFSTNYNL